MTNKEVIEILKKHISPYSKCKADAEANMALDLAIKALKERPTGKWEEIKSSCDIGHRFFHCSVCNRFLDVMTADGETLEDYPFCHCGADMRKQSEGLEDD